MGWDGDAVGESGQKKKTGVKNENKIFSKVNT